MRARNEVLSELSEEEALVSGQLLGGVLKAPIKHSRLHKSSGVLSGLWN